MLHGLFARGLLFQVIWVGMLMGAITLATQAFGVNAERDSWQTLVFTVLTLSQMWQIMAIRSDHFSLFQQGNSPWFTSRCSIRFSTPSR